MTNLQRKHYITNTAHCQAIQQKNSEWQMYLQECIRQDTRGMRGKARRADQNDESRNRRDEKTREERIRKDGRPRTVAHQYLGCGKQR